MNRREKILLIVMGAAFGLIVIGKAVYPKWVKPLLSFDGQVARLRGELEDLECEIGQVDQAREEYRDYVYRTGGTNEKDVGNQFTSTLNDLLVQCRLRDVQVSPKGGSTDRKTGLVTLSYGIRAKGPLEKAALFLKNFYELPYIARFKDFKLVPQRNRRRGKRSETVALTGNIDVLVPPSFFRPIPEDIIIEGQPTRLVKYRTNTYASIWEKDPFNQPEKKKPPPPPPPPPDEPDEPEPEEVKVAVWTGDPKRRQKKIQGCWASIKEVTVFNTASKRTEVVRVGEKLDGGTLLMVHPYGVLVRRNEEKENREYLYPQGKLLANAVALRTATGEPQLQAVAHYFLAKEEPCVEQGTGGARTPPEPSSGVLGDQAGPPEELAGPLPDKRSAGTPTTSPTHSDSRGRSPEAVITDLAGPPLELAGGNPESDDEMSAEEPSPSNKRDRDMKLRSIRKKSSSVRSKR